MPDKPRNLGQRPVNEIIDHEYANGVAIDTLVGNMRQASRIPSFLVPRTREAQVAAARQQINSAEHAPLSAFYLALNEAGLLPENPRLTSDVIQGFRNVLAVIDTNGDQQINATEMRAVANAGPARKAQLAEQISTR